MKNTLLLLLAFLAIPLSAREGVEDELYVYRYGRVTTVELLEEDPGVWRSMPVFPVRDSADVVQWYAAKDELPEAVMDDFDRWVFIRKSLGMVEKAVREENWAEAGYLIEGIRAYQEKVAGDELPSAAKVRGEKLYNRIARPKIPFMVSLAAGLLLFILTILSFTPGRPVPKGMMVAAIVLSSLLLAYLTLVLGLNWYVSGHAPLSGTYCVMLLIAWLALLLALPLCRRIPVLLPSGLMLAGFSMLVASLSFADPSLTAANPALQSPFLAVHVLSMMVSYSLLGLAALNGVLGLAVKSASQRLAGISRRILYPAVFFLTAGIILGSFWAKSAWGSYWSWDPKETWALITWLIYGSVLLCASLGVFRRPRLFHLCTLLAFGAVLFTYFGVNFILGGMHAYA